jgi:group I intron endonuclease
MATIYKATNTINGKSYIGFDSKYPDRKREHLTNAFNPKHNAYHTIFHNAIRKYGTEAFIWEVLFETPDSLFALNVLESRFIQEHNTHHIHGYGYNMSLGGEGSFGSPRNVWTEIMKINHSLRMRGRNKGPKTSEHKKNLSRARIGKKANPETIAKMSKAHYGKKRGSYKKKEVTNCTDLNKQS